MIELIAAVASVALAVLAMGLVHWLGAKLDAWRHG